MYQVAINTISGVLCLIGGGMFVCSLYYLKRGTQGRGAAHKVQA